MGQQFARRSSRDGPWRRKRPHGFTILEMLVTVAVIAVLGGLLLTALRPSREGAKHMTSLSLHRQFLLGVSMYSGDYDGFFPFLGEAGRLTQHVRVRGWRHVLGQRHFMAQKTQWATLIAPQYVGVADPGVLEFDRDSDLSMFAPINGEVRNPNPIMYSRYWLTNTVAADARFWDDVQAPDDLTLLRGVRQASVKYPAQKGLLFDTRYAALRQQRYGQLRGAIASFGLADGSAAMKPWPDPEDRQRVVDRVGFGAHPWPIMSTRHGVHGRDF